MKAVAGGTVIDGTGREPVENATVLIDRGRIQAVLPASSVGSLPEDVEVVDARGKHVIPGLVDANVHLSCPFSDVLFEYEDRYTELVEEGAQLTLRSGVTTVFDTWGHLDALIAVRDRIERGEVVGSRLFVAGNIIGLGGPLSADFFPPEHEVDPATAERINAPWVQGVGQDLLWLPPEEVRDRVRRYVERSQIDFVKYAASGHGPELGRFITFSAPAQSAIVEEAHRAGLTVQAHTTTVESLRMEIEAGADILQHGNSTGLQPIPESTIATIVDRQLPVAAIAFTEKYLAWLAETGAVAKAAVMDQNLRTLIDAGARILLTTDANVVGPRIAQNPIMAPLVQGAPDLGVVLGEAHFLWLESVVERGMSPMGALLAATRDVAEAYGQGAEVGTLTVGKRADLVILDGDPLADVRNYRRIVTVMKDGELVDPAALPFRPILTAPEGSAG